MIVPPDASGWWVIVHIPFDPKQAATFHPYETQVPQLVRKHRGQLQLAFCPKSREDGAEIHLRWFPNQAAFEKFQKGVSYNH
ncbi:MAG: hypothetical protein AAF399_28645 [Bacteroidota bacterium]